MGIWLPEKTQWMVEQNQHKPTVEYANEIFDLCIKFEPAKSLEIGCIWAVSTLTILFACKKTHLLSVDPIPQNNPNMHAMTEVRHNKLKDRWDYYTGRSEDFWKQNKQQFDLIYIDGSHLYKDVKNDLFNAWDVLSKKGVVILDDYLHDHNHENDYGVSLAVLEFMYKKQINPIHMGKHCVGFIK